MMACATFLTLNTNETLDSKGLRSSTREYLGNSACVLQVRTGRQNSEQRSVDPLVALPPPVVKCEKKQMIDSLGFGGRTLDVASSQKTRLGLEHA